MPTNLKLGASLGGVAVGAAAAVSYLLRATFTADDQSITDGQVLDTAAEGVETGSVTVADGAVGTWSIASNALQCVKSSTATPNATFISDDYLSSYARGNCLIVGYKNVNSGSWSIGWLDSTSPPTTSYQDFAIMQWGSNDMYIESFDAGPILFYTGAVDGATEEKAAIVVGGYDSSYVPWDGSAAGYSEGASFFFDDGSGWKLGYRYRESVFAAPATAWTVGGVIENGITQTFTKMLVPDVDLSSLLAPTVLDTFTDTNGTALESHTSDSGHAWTAQNGSYNIQTNKATSDAAAPGGSGYHIATVDSGESDCCIEVVVNRGTANNLPSLIVRYADDDNYWLIRTADTTFTIWERNGGAWTQRATIAKTFNTSTDYRLFCVLEGTTITAYADDGSRISYGSASLNSSSAKHGIGGQGTAAGETTFDNFAVYPRTGYTDLDNY